MISSFGIRPCIYLWTGIGLSKQNGSDIHVPSGIWTHNTIVVAVQHRTGLLPRSLSDFVIHLLIIYLTTMAVAQIIRGNEKVTSVHWKGRWRRSRDAIRGTIQEFGEAWWEKLGWPVSGLKFLTEKFKIRNTDGWRALVLLDYVAGFNVRIMELFCDRSSRTVRTSVIFRIRLLSFSIWHRVVRYLFTEPTASQPKKTVILLPP
jgi:hypothetical protein